MERNNNEEEIFLHGERITFKKTQILGTGHSGQVWVYKGFFGSGLKLKPIAVKFIPRKCQLEFQNQVSALVHCDHNNIIRFYGHGSDNEFFYLALDRCACTLEKWVIDISLRSSLKGNKEDILYEVTLGLEYLHLMPQPIVHANLKQENILLKREGEKVVVKISGFSACKIMDDDHTSQTDIFSLGEVFYFVLTDGGHPHTNRRNFTKEFKGAIRLISLMTQNEQGTTNGLSISTIRNHHIFWSMDDKIQFLSAAFKLDELHWSDEASLVEGNANKFGHDNTDANDWILMLCNTLQNHIRSNNEPKKKGNTKPYNGLLLRDLLRAIRNFREHYATQPDDVKRALCDGGNVLEVNKYANYWLLRFPFVVDLVWTAFRKKRIETLDEFYADSVDSGVRGRRNTMQRPCKIMFDVVSPTPLFTGREEELEKLQGMVEEDGGNIGTTKIICVMGLGGNGKTTFCRKFISQQYHNFDYVICFTAENESKLQEAFRRLAKEDLKIECAEREIKSIVKDVYQILGGFKTLLLFDNVEDYESVKEYLPLDMAPRTESNKLAVVIMTSRNQKWAKGINKLNLKGLKPREAMELVKEGLKIQGNSEDEEIEKLCAIFQCLPLGLRGAISYISENRLSGGYSIKKYLEDLERRPKTLLRYRVENDIFNDYTKSTLTAWIMTLEKIGENEEFGKLALKILRCMSYFAPDEVPRRSFLLLAQGDDTDDDPEHDPEDLLSGAVRLLVQYSMIYGNEDQTILSIHRIVQEVIRQGIKSNTVSEEKEEQVLGTVLASHFEFLRKEKSVIDHALYSWKHAWKYPALVKKLCKLSTEMVEVLVFNARSEEAIAFAQLALENLPSLDKSLPKDEDEAKSVYFIRKRHGGALYNLRRLQEARDLFIKLYEDASNAYGETSRGALSARASLAYTYSAMGEVREALRIRREMIDRSQEYEEIGPFTKIVWTQNLSESLLDLGEYAKCSRFVKDQLLGWARGHEAVDNRESRTGLYVKNNLGRLLYRMGRYSEAKDMILSALEGTKVLNEYKSEEAIMTFLGHLAPVLTVCGEITDEDLHILQDSHEKHVQFYGEEHVLTLVILCHLGTLLLQIGKEEQAYEYHKRAYDGILKAMGGHEEMVTINSENSIALQTAKSCLAASLSALGNPSEAFNAFEEVRKFLQKKFELNQKHYEILELEIKYAQALIQHECKEKARKLLVNLQSKLEDPRSDRMLLVTKLLSQTDNQGD